MVQLTWTNISLTSLCQSPCSEHGLGHFEYRQQHCATISLAYPVDVSYDLWSWVCMSAYDGPIDMVALEVSIM